MLRKLLKETTKDICVDLILNLVVDSLLEMITSGAVLSLFSNPVFVAVALCIGCYIIMWLFIYRVVRAAK